MRTGASTASTSKPASRSTSRRTRTCRRRSSGCLHKRPGVALVGLNDREPEWHDLYEIDVATGKRKLVEKNDHEFGGYLADRRV